MANWKDVGIPYWDGTYVKIECIGERLLTDKRYYAKAYCGSEVVSSIELTDATGHTLPERTGILIFTETGINKWCSPLPFNVDIILTEGWDEKDRIRRTIPEKEEPCDAVIIACNINKLPCPNCGNANEGDEIEVIMGMSNHSDEDGEFRFYIYDQDGNELSREPDVTYKNVKAHETWGVSKTLTTNLNFKMINKTLNGTVKLVKKT